MQNFYGGGAEKVIVNLANELFRLGHPITIVVNDNNGPYFHDVANGIGIVELKKKRLIFGVLKLYQLLAKIQPDYFLSTLDMPNVINGIIALMNSFTGKLNCKFIAREANTISSYSWLDNSGLLIKIYARKYLYKKINLVIANSPDTKEEIVKKLSLSAHDVVAIGNPVLKVIDIPAMQDDFCTNTASTEYKLITVGRLERQKNLFFLLDVIKKMSLKYNVTLDIYGVGSLEVELKKYVEKLGLNNIVSFEGFHDDVCKRYSQYDAFILTSLWEGFGNVYVEALSGGIPIITTDSKGGARYIINDSDIGSICPFDVDNIVDSVVFEISKNTKEKREKRFSRAGDFTVDNIAKQYRRVCYGVE